MRSSLGETAGGQEDGISNDKQGANHLLCEARVANSNALACVWELIAISMLGINWRGRMSIEEDQHDRKIVDRSTILLQSFCRLRYNGVDPNRQSMYTSAVRVIYQLATTQEQQACLYKIARSVTT